MTNDSPIDRTKVTFSQAEGLESLPVPLALRELSQQVRSLLWHVIHERLERCVTYAEYTGTRLVDVPWRTILHHYHVLEKHLPTDEFSDEFSRQVDRIKSAIFNGKYNEVFDFLPLFCITKIVLKSY